MAQQTANRRNPANISRYSESLSPQFIGGDIDPRTGNLIPAGRSAVATGSSSAPQTVGASPSGSSPSTDTSEDAPRQPTSRLSTISAANPDLASAPQLPTFVGSTPSSAPASAPSSAPTYTAPALAPSAVRPVSAQPQPNAFSSILPSLLAAGGSLGAKIAFGGGDKPVTSGRTADSGGASAGAGVGGGFSDSGGVSTTSQTALPDITQYTPPSVDQTYQGSYVDPASVPQYEPPPSFASSVYEPPAYVYEPPTPSFEQPTYNDEPAYWEPPAPAPVAAATPSYSGGPTWSPAFGWYDGGGNTGGYTAGGPQGSDFGSGFSVSTVICTELHSQGLLDDATYAADGQFGAMVRLHYPDVYYGYIAWAPSVVRIMRRSKLATKAVAWFALPWAQCMAVRSGFNGYPPLRGWLIYYGGFEVCRVIGKLRRLKNALRQSPIHP